MTIALADLLFNEPEHPPIRRRKLNDLVAHVRTISDGLGTAAAKDIGTSGDTVPVLNGGNTTWGGGMILNANFYAGLGVFTAGARGQAYGSSSFGLVLAGEGSVDDILMVNKSGQTVLEVLTGARTASFGGNVEPLTDDASYLGRNDDDSPKAWKGLILHDQSNGKTYRIEMLAGVLTATDLTD